MKMTLDELITDLKEELELPNPIFPDCICIRRNYAKEILEELCRLRDLER